MLVLGIWLTASGAALANETVYSHYDVRLIGAKVGEMVVASQQTASRYSTRARFKTTGAFAKLSQASFDLSSKGRISGKDFIPQSYREITREGRYETNVSISYRAGIASDISGKTGGRVPPVKPGDMRGALDPLTGIYAALSDQNSADVCGLSIDIYDGQRHARLVLTNRQDKAQNVICSGHYRRIAGYSSSRARTQVPVAIHYRRHAEALVTQRVIVSTRYGKVTLHRR